jgi:hypothetical protein
MTKALRMTKVLRMTKALRMTKVYEKFRKVFKKKKNLV